MRQGTMSTSLRRNGFTLIEILLSVALIAAMFAVTGPVLNSFYLWNELNVTATETAQSLRRAQALARAGDHDSEWGVHVGAGQVVLFQGSTYAGRVASYDELFTYPTAILAGGLTDIAFSKNTGVPTVTGTVTFTSPQNQTKTISVNSVGTVSY